MGWPLKFMQEVYVRGLLCVWNVAVTSRTFVRLPGSPPRPPPPLTARRAARSPLSPLLLESSFRRTLSTAAHDDEDGVTWNPPLSSPPWPLDEMLP